MRECMETDNPSVAILMAVYKPDERLLAEQLKSLDRQTYPNINLLIYDDCPDFPLDEKIVSRLIKSFPYRIIRGEKNLGSNKAFERLTVEGEGEYFAYCDQDDVWHEDKISRMADVLRHTGSPLVCSDVAIIDGDGKLIADSITKVRKRHTLHEGENLAEYLMVRNFVTGCAMMIRAEIAKKSVPFIDSLVHDQWLAINAALAGRIEVIREPLIDYRQHAGNQTSVLMGITDKQSYYEERILKFGDRIEEYRKRLYDGELKNVIDQMIVFNDARISYFNKATLRDLKIMRRYRQFAASGVKLEIAMKLMPEWLFKKVLMLIKEGKV